MHDYYGLNDHLHIERKHASVYFLFNHKKRHHDLKYLNGVGPDWGGGGGGGGGGAMANMGHSNGNSQTVCFLCLHVT